MEEPDTSFPLAILLLVALTSCDLVTVGRAAAGAAAASHARREAALISDLNAERGERRLPALRESALLRGAATGRLRDMQRRRYFGHYGPDGVGYQRIREVYPHRHGECLAVEFGAVRPVYPPGEALASLLDSPPHRKLLLGRFNEVGVAAGPVDLPRGKGVVYVVLVGQR